MSDTYYTHQAWIPTNLGKLQKNLILTSEYNKVKEKKEFYLMSSKRFDASDTIIPKNKKKQISLYTDFTIDFDKVNWTFTLKIYEKKRNILQNIYQKIKKRDFKDIWKAFSFVKVYLIEAEGDIHQNGMTYFKFNNYMENGNFQNISNTIFTYVKQRVHQDLHHQEKIDNVIPVCLKDENIHLNTINALITKIKSIEIDAKRTYRDANDWSYVRDIENLYWDAKGFCAYAEAFSKLFRKELENNKENILTAKPIIESLNALREKIKVEQQNRTTMATIIVSMIGLFISLNIVMQNKLSLDFGEYEWLKSLIIISIVLVISEKIIHLYFGKGSVLSIFNNKSNQKEYYQRIYVVGMDKTLISFTDKLKFWLIKYYHYIVFPIIIYLIYLIENSIYNLGIISLRQWLVEYYTILKSLL